MTLTINATVNNASSSAATAVTPAVPDGNVGDLLIWVVGWAYSGATSIANRPTLSGGVSASATHVGSIFGGGGTFGANGGSRGLSHWSAIATSTSGATDAVSFTNGAAGILGAEAIRISRDQTKNIDIAFTGGIDTSAGDSWAPTGLSDIGAIANDLTIHSICGVPSATNPVVALAWPGTTLGTESNLKTSAYGSTVTIRLNTRQRPITAGPSTGAPTLTSATTGMTGVEGLIRIREITPVGGWQLGSIAMG